MTAYVLRLLPASLLALILASCGGSTAVQNPASLPPEIPEQPGITGMEWPADLPADAVQPWERDASGISAESEFLPGRDLFSSSMTGASENGEATRLESSSGQTAWATYRIPTGGESPGVLSLDVNLLAHSDAGLSEYYVGVANYGTGRWQWQGPFSDSHVRLALPESGALSPVNSFFATLLCHGGSNVDIVGVGLGMRIADDSTPPPVPIALTATAVAGGAELQWFPVLSGDLAGYEIFWSAQSFVNPDAAGVRSRGWIEGSTHTVLTGLAGETFVRLRSVDHNGNASELSDEVAVTPLSGAALPLLVSTDSVSGGVGDPINILVSGADSYDYDTDGNGVFDITGDAGGSFSVDTTLPGIIRPRVRASGSGGERVALGSVSLIVSSNSRPVASATADPQSGLAPLDVTFTGEAEDAEDEPGALEFAWDFDGDGIFEAGTDTLTPPLQSYAAAGIINAKLRVTDSEGAWDVDTISILATDGGVHAELAMAQSLIGKGEYAIFSAESSTSSSTITKYEWDLDGDLVFELDMGTDPLLKRSFDTVGFQQLALRVTDDLGRFDIDIDTLVVEGWSDPAEIPGTAGSFISYSLEVDGFPGICFGSSGTSQLTYIRASDWQGTGWGTPVGIGEPALNTFYPRMAIVNGNPAVAYSGLSDDQLHYVRALDAHGSSWAAPMVVTTDVSESEIRGLVVADGNPAISYKRKSDGALMYVRAANPQGSAWSAPAVVNDSTMYAGNDMEIVNGRPCIAVRQQSSSELHWFRAANPQGSSWGAPVVVDDVNVAGLFADIVVTGGRPGIFYLDNDTIKWVMFCIASDINGSSWETPVQLDNASNSNSHMGAAVIDGRPAIGYKNPAFGTMFIQARDSLGTEWEAPQVVIPAEHGFSHMCSVTDRPFVVITGNSGSLKFTNFRP